MRCPHCGSRMIVPAADHKNFSVGKAVAGAVVAGPIGAAAGFIGKDIQGYRCNTCGAFSKTPMNAVDESLINTAVERAKNSGDRISYERLCSQYPGIEQIAGAPKAAVGSDRSLEVETYEDEEDGWEEVSGPSVKRAYAPNKLVKGCPVLVEKVIIQKGTSEDLLALVVRNISGKTLRSVYFKVTVFDDVGDQITECSCVYQGLTAAPGVRLPEEKVFNLKTDVAYKLAIVCEKAAFTDDSVWRQSEEPVEYDLQEMLELTPGNFKEYKYLRILLSQNTHVDENASIFRPVFAPEYRICVCGTPVTDHEKCPVCGLSEEKLLAVIDYNALTECRRALIRENARKRADEMQAILEQAKEDTYNEAIRLKESKTRTGCEKAVQLFASLEDFKDAASQKALCEDKVKDYIYDEAITMTRKRVPRQEDYLAAIQEFKKISGWKDADAQIENCQKKIEELKAEEERERQEALERERQEELARIAAEKKKRLITVIAVIIGAAALLFFILWQTVIAPSMAYNEAIALMDAGKYEEAIAAFEAMDGHKDSAAKIGECKTAILDGKYNAAVALMDAGKYEEAIAAFEALNGHKDSADCIKECQYRSAIVLKDTGNYFEAILAFRALDDYKDSAEQVNGLWTQIAQRDTVSAGDYHTAGLKADGTVVAVGKNWISHWADVVAISAGFGYAVGLKADGTVVASNYTGADDYGQCYVSHWSNIVAISAGGWHTVGLKADGTAVAVGKAEAGRTDVSDWSDIVAISAGRYHTVGLKADGTVVATEYTGRGYEGQCDVSDWSDIVAISAGGWHTVGLKADGTVVAVGSDYFDQYDVSDWTDIVAISAGDGHTVGLKADGTVVAVGDNDDGQCNVSGWTDIVAISAGGYHTVGLKADGTVVAVGGNGFGQCNVSGWWDIKTK